MNVGGLDQHQTEIPFVLSRYSRKVEMNDKEPEPSDLGSQPFISGQPVIHASYDSHASTNSMGLIPTADLYHRICVFVKHYVHTLCNSDINEESNRLLELSESFASSTALLNHKIGQFLANFVDDLLNQLTVAPGGALSEAENEANAIQRQDITTDAYVAGVVLLLVVIKSTTGQSDSSLLSELVKVEPPQPKTKRKRLRVKKLWKKVRQWISIESPPMSDAADDYLPLNVDLNRELSDAEVTRFLGFLMEVSNMLFGSDVGPTLGLRYAPAVYELSVLHQCKGSDSSTVTRIQRLQNSAARLHRLCHRYHVKLLGPSNQGFDADLNGDFEFPHFDPNERKKLRMEAIELLGKLIADVVRDAPENVLQIAVSLISGSQPDVSEPFAHRSEIQKANSCKLENKIIEFSSFLDMINKAAPSAVEKSTADVSALPSISKDDPCYNSEMNFQQLKMFWATQNPAVNLPAYISNTVLVESDDPLSSHRKSLLSLDNKPGYLRSARASGDAFSAPSTHTEDSHSVILIEPLKGGTIGHSTPMKSYAKRASVSLQMDLID